MFPTGFEPAAKPAPPKWIVDVIGELTLAFPELATDGSRARYARDKLLEHGEREVRIGVKDYIENGGDELFKISHCLAYIEGAEKDERERQGAERRRQERERERQGEVAIAGQILKAEAFIAEMSDAEVVEMWEPIRAGLYIGWTLNAAKKWSVKTIRGNMHLKHHVAGLLSK